MMGELSIILGGDVSTSYVAERVDKAYAEKALRQMLPLLEKADFRLINLENPLLEGGTPIPKSGPPLKGLPKNIEFLKAGGFDCAILANNHFGDYGKEGIESTLRLLQKHQIAHVGGGLTLEESWRPWIVEKNSVRVAVLAVGENEFGAAGSTCGGMAGLHMRRLFRAIREAKEKQKARFVLVVVHGGNEGNPLPSPRVVERYRMMVEFGADAVVGMHPHCPQGMENYHGAPIVYSTGNFYFPGDKGPQNSQWYYGYMPKLTFSTDGVSLEIFPYTFEKWGTEITPLIGEQKEKMMEYLQKLSRLFQDPAEHEAYFKGWCMIAGPVYAEMMVFRQKYLEEEKWSEDRDFLNLRNLYTCEAHNELMTSLLMMIENKELAFGKEMAEKVKKLQKMPF